MSTLASQPSFFEIFTGNKKNDINLSSEELTRRLEEATHEELNIFAPHSQENPIASPLCCAFRYHKDQELNMNQEQWLTLIRKSDLSYQTYNKRNAFMIYCYLKERQNLNLPPAAIDLLIDKCDMNFQDNANNTPLSLAFFQYRSEQLYFTPHQWLRLIEKSPDKALDYYGLNCFALGLRFQPDVRLPMELLKLLEDKSGYSLDAVYDKQKRASVEASLPEYLEYKIVLEEQKKLEQQVPLVNVLNNSQKESLSDNTRLDNLRYLADNNKSNKKRKI